MHRICAMVTILSALISSLPAQSAKRPVSKKTTSADRRLTLDQIRKLIGIHSPDSLIAKEIQSRGIAGDYTRRDVDAMREKGAGPETVAAMLRAVPVGTVVVRTTVNAAVKLDDTQPVLAGADGTVRFVNTEPGKHRLNIQKQYFTSISKEVPVKGGETLSVDAMLEWAVGFLNATADVSNAQIQPSGFPAQTGPVSHMAVPIGGLVVVATAPLRKTVSQIVMIAPGKEASVSFSLPIDEAAIIAVETQIHAAFRERSYHVVVQEAGSYLQTGSHDKDVLTELAISYFEMSDYTSFQNAAQLALSAGGTLRFELMHHHLAMGGFGGGTLHRAELQVSAANLGYKPLDDCNLPEFQVPTSDVHMGRRQQALLDKGRRIPVVDLDVPQPGNPKKQTNLNFSAGQLPEGVRIRKMHSAVAFREDNSKVDAVRQFLQTVLK